MGNGDATIIQRHMEFNGGIAYGIDRLLEPPDLGSRCDEFTLTELPVSTWDGLNEDLGHPCSLCLGTGTSGGLAALPWQSSEQPREAAACIELL